MIQYTDTLEAIANDPLRKDLRWMAAIDDDLLKSDIRQCEFVNWLQFEVINNN